MPSVRMTVSTSMIFKIMLSCNAGVPWGKITTHLSPPSHPPEDKTILSDTITANFLEFITFLTHYKTFISYHTIYLQLKPLLP